MCRPRPVTAVTWPSLTQVWWCDHAVGLLEDRPGLVLQRGIQEMVWPHKEDRLCSLSHITGMQSDCLVNQSMAGHRSSLSDEEPSQGNAS